MNFEIAPIAHVRAARKKPVDDYWGGEMSEIELVESIDQESLYGLESFSHIEVLFVFHQLDPEKICTQARHPRNNQVWPRVGIFAQRGKNRPNRIGSTICKVVSVDGKKITVSELDAIAGTPVIDIKPVMKEFLPRTEVIQPPWSVELMADYWSLSDSKA